MVRPDGPIRVVLARPRGFCAGVVRAIEVVEKSLKVFEGPVYVRHEIVHNRQVVDDLQSKGAMSVEDLDSVPDGATVIFSAHGVSKSVSAEAKRRGLNTIDGTCPLVTKVHRQVHRLSAQGYEIILVGHAGHPEVEGTMGQLIERKIILIQSVDDAERVEIGDPKKIAYVTQTTLSLDDADKIVSVLLRRFPRLQPPPTDDICYATQNRQDAVRRLVQSADLVIVIGAANSSNSNRLVEVAASRGVPSYRIDCVSDLNATWFRGAKTVGITAGASAPEYLVQEVVSHLKACYGAEVESDLDGSDEDVHFPLPRNLAAAMRRHPV